MSPRRVLVVDDDDAIREVAQMALEIVGGLDVSTASSGGEALKAIRANPPAAILLDVMMPGMDGPTLLAHLRGDEATHDIPVVLLTAKVQGGERREWAGLAVTGIISKPFDPMTLASEMSALLGWSP